MKVWLFRNLFVLLIIIIICISKSPTLPVFAGIISGFMFGIFFVMYGLDDKELEKYEKEEVKNLDV